MSRVGAKLTVLRMHCCCALFFSSKKLECLYACLFKDLRVYISCGRLSLNNPLPSQEIIS